MNNKDFEKAVKTLMSMCTSYLMGTLNKETFVANLKVFTNYLDQ